MRRFACLDQILEQADLVVDDVERVFNAYVYRVLDGRYDRIFEQAHDLHGL